MAMTETERVRKRLTRLIQAAHNENYDFVYIPVGTAKLILKLLDERGEKSDEGRKIGETGGSAGGSPGAEH